MSACVCVVGAGIENPVSSKIPRASDDEYITAMAAWSARVQAREEGS